VRVLLETVRSVDKRLLFLWTDLIKVKPQASATNDAVFLGVSRAQGPRA